MCWKALRRSCRMGEGKSGWRRLSLSEMVTSAGATRKARGWDVNSAGVDRYVGLEHLDSNSLPIRRWGDPREVGENSDIRHFEAGDVLLARRAPRRRTRLPRQRRRHRLSPPGCGLRPRLGVQGQPPRRPSRLPSILHAVRRVHDPRRPPLRRISVQDRQSLGANEGGVRDSSS